MTNNLKEIKQCFDGTYNELIERALGQRVTVKMPMIMKNNKTGIRSQRYAIYTGYLADMSGFEKKDNTLRYVYYLTGANGRGYVLKITKHNAYSMMSDKSSKPIAIGTMSDRYAPEIVLK